MYNLCSQHLQSLNSVQQKLFVLQPLKDINMFQMRSQPQVQPWVVTALTRPEPIPDFYLWGYLKDRVYEHNPQTIPDLKAAITAAIRAIPKEEEGHWELCQANPSLPAMPAVAQRVFVVQNWDFADVGYIGCS